MPIPRPSPVMLAGRLLLALAVSSVGAGALVAAAPQSPPADPQKPAPGTAQQPAAGAAQQPAGQQPPTFRTEANFVRVDVYPTADGRAVQDLTQADFEVLEDGKPQDIRTFEHVVIEAGGPTETRSEPRNVRESRDMAADPRARLFVLFLDTYHVGREGAYNVRRSLSRLLQRTIGPMDLVAVMTPDMSAGSVTFTRRTGSIDDILDKWITWGKRNQETMDPDPIEERYQFCYPPQPGEGRISAIAQEMISRRREQMTLDAMKDLVNYLTGLREERKAILTISEGWLLYRPNSNLARMVNGRTPGTPQPVGVGAGGGLQMGDPSRNPGGATARECDSDRMMLAQEDHDRQFRELLDEANRGNASFYTVDPRGLPVFDTDIGPNAPPPVDVDASMLRSRQDALQTLATATDGIAVMNSNDIDKGLRRVVDDLTSYYLLGYYSTNAKPDGRFHSINVKVKRPGVSVRARRGYRSPTRDELEGVRKAEAAAAGKSDVSPVSRAVGTLAKVRTEAPVHSAIGYEWRPSPSGAPSPTLWVVTELDADAPVREEAYRAGADVAITVATGDKVTVKEVQQTLKREQRSALLRIPLPDTLPGDYSVRITSKPAGATLGSTETLRLMVPRLEPTSLVLGQALLYRRGPFSGAGWQVAGDPRYRRQERVKVEIPALGAVTGAQVQLLDRTGKPLTNIPVVSATRDENGQTIVSGEVVLAPLTTGDYVLEATIKTATAETKVASAFRIVP